MRSFALILLVAQLCLGLPRQQRQQDVEVLESARVNCKVTAVVTYPSTTEEGALPTVECTKRCKLTTEDKDKTYFVGYVYRHFDRLEKEYGLMLQILYNKGTDGANNCVLVPAIGDEEKLSTHVEGNSACDMTTVPSTTLPTTLPPTTFVPTTVPVTHDSFTTLPTTLPPTTFVPTTVPVTHDSFTTLPTTLPPTTTISTTLPHHTPPTTMPTIVPVTHDSFTTQGTTLSPTTIPSTTVPTTAIVPTTTSTTEDPCTTSPATTTVQETTPYITTKTTLPTTTTTPTAAPTTTTTPTTTKPTTTTTPTTTTSTTTTTTTTTTTPTTTTSWVCGSDWVLIGTACFHLSEVRGDWSEGQDYCAGLGATLASIRSQEEQDGLAGLIDGNAWIGLHDMHSEGEHLWEDQTTLSYTNWAPGQPDNSGTFLWWGSGEDCVEVNLGNSFQWNDQDCDNENKYICRSDAILQG